MKIALVVPGFSAHEGDWCIPALHDLVRVLAARHEVHVIALRYPHRRGSYRVAGATVHALGGARAAGWRRGPLLARGLHRLRRAGPWDVVHGLWADEPGLLALLAGRLSRAPVVVSLMGGELERWPDLAYGHGLSRAARAMVALALRGADAVTVGSDFLARRAARRVGGGRLVRCPLGVERARFFPHGPRARLGDGLFHLLHVASLSPIKEQGMLLRVLDRVQAEHAAVRLHLVGEGASGPALRAEAARLGVAGALHFHGALPHDALPPLYRAATLHLLSSRYESQCMAVLEAAACGVPTVGTAVGIVPEMGAGAWPVPPGDDGAMADAILALLADPAARASRGRAAQARVAERFALPGTVEALLALYARVGAGEG